jgi:hypothetical protein
MNSVTIIVIIIVLLACLVCYAFVSQTLEQKRQHRQRLLAALQIRAGTFKYMLNSFPAGFLSRELALLVQRTLVDIYEQLTKLDPKNETYKQDLHAVTQRMNETWRQPQQPQSQILESNQQIREIKRCLEELYKVVYHQESRRTLNSREAEVYRTQIKQLSLSITVDSYILHGQQARQSEKLRLAQHYFTIAQKLLVREDTSGAFDAKKSRLTLWLEELDQQLRHIAPEASAKSDGSDEQAEIDKAWEKFNQADENWKKKNLYD